MKRAKTTRMRRRRTRRRTRRRRKRSASSRKTRALHSIRVRRSHSSRKVTMTKRRRRLTLSLLLKTLMYPSKKESWFVLLEMLDLERVVYCRHSLETCSMLVHPKLLSMVELKAYKRKLSTVSRLNLSKKT